MIIHTRKYKYSHERMRMRRKGIARNIYPVPPSLEDLKKYNDYYFKQLMEAYHYIHNIGGFNIDWVDGKYLIISKTFNINKGTYYDMFVSPNNKTYQSINAKKKFPICKNSPLKGDITW